MSKTQHSALRADWSRYLTMMAPAYTLLIAGVGVWSLPSLSSLAFADTLAAVLVCAAFGYLLVLSGVLLHVPSEDEDQ